MLLVAAEDVELPDKPQVEVLRLSFPSKTKNLWQREWARLSAAGSPVTARIDRELRSKGIKPRAYFLNQTDLVDSAVSTPQFVVAWSYPTSFGSYLQKIVRITGGGWTIANLRIGMETIGWWRKDWKTYRSDASPIAVSERLGKELQSLGVAARIIHPGTRVAQSAPDSLPRNGRRRAFITALELDEPRKRVLWMLDALNKFAHGDFEIYLYGKASSAFERALHNYRFPIHYMGYQNREELQQAAQTHDVLLFGSVVDDWGYVLVEALANGVPVVAANISPFDEIVGNAGKLYAVNSAIDFAQQFSALCAENIGDYRSRALARARTLFSREVFGQKLLQAYHEHSGQASV